MGLHLTVALPKTIIVGKRSAKQRSANCYASAPSNAKFSSVVFDFSSALYPALPTSASPGVYSERYAPVSLYRANISWYERHISSAEAYPVFERSYVPVVLFKHNISASFRYAPNLRMPRNIHWALTKGYQTKYSRRTLYGIWWWIRRRIRRWRLLLLDNYYPVTLLLLRRTWRRLRRWFRRLRRRGQLLLHNIHYPDSLLLLRRGTQIRKMLNKFICVI